MAKKSKPSPAPARDIDLPQAVDRLTDMLSVVEDTLAQIKCEMTWIINNRRDFRSPVPVITRLPKKACDPEWGAKLAAINKPEAIACTDCEACADSLAVALNVGWVELVPCDGPDANYSGICPACWENEYGYAPSKEPNKQASSAEPTPDTQQPAAESAANELQDELPRPKDTLF